jgi:hypothetical protein
MKVYYNDSYVSSTDGFPTVAKAGAVARSLRKDPIEGVEITDPSGHMEETERLVRRVHSREYVEAVRSGTPGDIAGSSGLAHARGLDPFDLVIVNSGMDPVNDGVPAPVMRTREKMVRDFVGDTPAVFAFAGGYTWGGHTMDDIVSWHRLTVREWASR